ncbi:autotransporter outer membrane beta-barrel domain-containing protein [Martelella alba]|uniref:autotransporter outer membrane beta-barrel domain-containing protein n=1 Tax=Martelella alba TaxID=2590451 RepID=UPI0014858EFE|nr:autotransporter outer membrane beta-barrel domain-containing protein [Martelella alba]
MDIVNRPNSSLKASCGTTSILTFIDGNKEKYKGAPAPGGDIIAGGDGIIIKPLQGVVSLLQVRAKGGTGKIGGHGLASYSEDLINVTIDKSHFKGGEARAANKIEQGSSVGGAGIFCRANTCAPGTWQDYQLAFNSDSKRNPIIIGSGPQPLALEINQSTISGGDRKKQAHGFVDESQQYAGHGLAITGSAMVNLYDAHIHGGSHDHNAAGIFVENGLINLVKSTVNSQDGAGIKLVSGPSRVLVSQSSTVIGGKSNGIAIEAQDRCSLSLRGKLKGNLYAVKFNGDENNLFLEPGYRLEGSIGAAGRNNVLIFDADTHGGGFHLDKIATVEGRQGFTDLHKIGPGNWELSGSNSAGVSLKKAWIEQGDLTLVNGARLNVDRVRIDKDAFFGGNGSVKGNVHNAGNLFFDRSYSTKRQYRTLTIDGNYHGEPGSLIMFDAKLGDDRTPADKLIIRGTATGSSQVMVTNHGGKGAKTDKGITLIQVLSDTLLPADTFRLNQRVVAGAYDYFLTQQGNDWLLTTTFPETLMPETLRKNPSRVSGALTEKWANPSKSDAPLPSAPPAEAFEPSLRAADAPLPSAPPAEAVMPYPGPADAHSPNESVTPMAAVARKDIPPSKPARTYTYLASEHAASKTPTEEMRNSSFVLSPKSPAKDNPAQSAESICIEQRRGNHAARRSDTGIQAETSQSFVMPDGRTLLPASGASVFVVAEDTAMSEADAPVTAEHRDAAGEEPPLPMPRSRQMLEPAQVNGLLSEDPVVNETVILQAEPLAEDTPLTPDSDPEPDPGPSYVPPAPAASGGRKALRPEVGSYVANSAAANSLFLTSMHDRIGEPVYPYGSPYPDAAEGSSLWLRTAGGRNDVRLAGGQISTRAYRHLVQLGGEILSAGGKNGEGFHLGLMAGHAQGHNRSQAQLSDYRATGSLDGYALGLYATWRERDSGRQGIYLDGALNYNWFDNRVKGETLAEERYRSRGFNGTLEAGYQWQWRQNADFSVHLQPQVQLAWMGVRTAPQGKGAERMTLHGAGNLQSRIGGRIALEFNGAGGETGFVRYKPFVEAHWIHSTRRFGMEIDGDRFVQDGGRHMAELKIGHEGQLNPHLSVWGNVGQRIGGGDYRDTVGTLGLKVRF